MYSTKTATTNNTEFNSSYMPVGINDNVNLTAVNVTKSPQGRDYIEFVFTNKDGQTASFTEWKNEKNMWIKTDEDLQRRDDQQFGRILQVMKCFYTDDLLNFEGESFVDMINWVKAKLDQHINSNLPKVDLRLKVVYDKNGYTRVSSLGTYVEPMSVEQSQIKLWKKDLLERPIVADNETAADPFASTGTSVTETTGADDLPF
jgi:hypothetical protein